MLIKMEQQNHNNSSDHQFVTSSQVPLKKIITKLVLSVSVLSLIVSYSSCCSFFIHYFKFYVIAFPWQLLSHASYKSYIFLICNGILVFIAKTSSLVLSPSSGPDLNDLLERKIGDDLQTLSKIEDSIWEKGDHVLENTKPQQDAKNHENGGVEIKVFKEEKMEKESFNVEDDEIEPRTELLMEEGEEGKEEGNEEETVTYILGDGGHSEKQFKNGLCMTEDDEEENDQNNFEDELFVSEEEKADDKFELLSTEELNKKFEDFIRRMKEGLRVEAQQQQQQLVMVK